MSAVRNLIYAVLKPYVLMRPGHSIVPAQMAFTLRLGFYGLLGSPFAKVSLELHCNVIMIPLENMVIFDDPDLRSSGYSQYDHSSGGKGS